MISSTHESGLPDKRRDSFIAPFPREWTSSICRRETEADRHISTSYRCITSGRTRALRFELPGRSHFQVPPGELRRGGLATSMDVPISSSHGITADRTFQIVAGAVVLSEAMRAFGVDELQVSPWALGEGLILRRPDRLS